MLAVIAGTGFYSLGKKLEELEVVTPFGVAGVQRVSLLEEEMLFIPRHGPGHTIPPHKINYRANVYALRKLGATGALTIHAAGIISKFRPADLVFIDDFISFWSPCTFYDSFAAGMTHANFSAPFSADMRKRLVEVSAAAKVKIKSGGIIATTPGPRYETRAEVKALKKLGANLVGMTAGYELALLGESEIDFAAIAVGTNYAAGISKKPVHSEGVMTAMRSAYGKLTTLIGGFAQEIV